MRTAALLISSICLAVLGFGIYWAMHETTLPPEIRRKPISVRTTMPASTQTFIGPVGDIWWDHYDPKTGQRTSRVRAARYEPQKDGRVLVIDPIAEFFLHDGRMIRIIGRIGFLTMQDNVPRGKNIPANANISQSPRSGDLRDVRIMLLPPPRRTDDGQLVIENLQPSLTMTTPHASFDNETFRITTEAYRDTAGKMVPRDQVPVTVRGEDYEFDGKGMSLIYNELDRRLERLEITHGQRLKVLKPGKFMKPASSSPQTLEEGRGEGYFPWHFNEPLPGIALAAASKSAVGHAPTSRPFRKPPPKLATTRPKKHRDTEEPVYRATFKDNVEVFQGDQRLATSDILDIEFMTDEDNDSPTTKPAATGATVGTIGTIGTMSNPLSTRPALAGARPTSKPVKSAIPTVGRSKSKSPATPATAPVEQPLEVRWTGPLVIIPIRGYHPERVAPGEAIVKLLAAENKSVHVTRQSAATTTQPVVSHLECATLTYWTMDQGALLESSPATPVHVYDSRGTNILTNSMLYSEEDGSAQLYGRSNARLPIEDPEQKGKTQFMNVNWADRCTLYFDGSAENMVVRRADLIGAVNVVHPQLAMDSDNLELLFDDPESPKSAPTTAPKSSSPPLRQLDAKGHVNCVATGPAGENDKRSIACDALKLVTAHAPDGKLYAHSLTATGHVKAHDPERQIIAGYLHAVLSEPPATRPAKSKTKQADISPGELKTLVAHDDVQIATADGKKAFADDLNIRKVGDETRVKLSGRPAKIVREKDTLIGEDILLVPETQALKVAGPGRLDGIQQEAPDKPARPIMVAWTQLLDGKGDNMECLGNVQVRSIDPDSTVNTAAGQKITVVTTRPSTQPATKPVKAPVAKKPSSTKPTSDLDVMSNRAVQSIILSGDAKTASELVDAKTGKLLRRFHVDSQQMEYYQPSETQKKLVIPGAGRLLYVDLRPPATQPGTQPVAATQPRNPFAQDSMSLHGRTAFGWQKSLVYEESANRMTMEGDVHIARIEQEGEKYQPMHVYGDRVIALILPADPKAAKSASPMPQGDIASKMQLKFVRIEGRVNVRSDQLNLEATTIDYDPIKHILTARGTERNRVRQLDKHELEMASFEELIWDTANNKIIDTKKPIFTSRNK